MYFDFVLVQQMRKWCDVMWCGIACHINKIMSKKILSNLHALTELCLSAGPVVVPTNTKPSLYFPFIPIKLLGQSLQLFHVWILRWRVWDTHRSTSISLYACACKTTTKMGNLDTWHKVFTERIII